MLPTKTRVIAAAGDGDAREDRRRRSPFLTYGGREGLEGAVFERDDDVDVVDATTSMSLVEERDPPTAAEAAADRNGGGGVMEVDVTLARELTFSSSFMHPSPSCAFDDA